MSNISKIKEKSTGSIYDIEDSFAREEISNLKSGFDWIESTLETSGVDRYVVSSDLFIAGKSLQSNGGTTDNTHRSVTNYIFCPKGSYIAVNDGYRFNVGEYSGLTASTLISYSTFRTSSYFIQNDCYVRFTVASIDDTTDVNANIASSAFIGFIIKASVKSREENQRTITDLSAAEIEYGSISTSGADIAATNRVRTTAAVFLKKSTAVTNKNGVSLAWRRFTDAEATEYEASSENFSTSDFVINVDGYYRFVFSQNNWSNGDLSMLISISNNTIGLYGEEISQLKEQTDPYVGYPILFHPTTPYKYTGEDIPLNIVDGTGDMLTTLYGWYDDLVSRFPNYISKSSIGTDQSGNYELRCYTINSYSTSVKPKILWISGIHASEPYTHTTTYMMVKELLEKHNGDDTLNFIWSNCTLMVVPIANPWGLANGGIRYNSRGVNLNRNFDADWVYDEAQYDNSGAAPQSESETQAIVNFIKTNSDAVFVISKHDSDTYDSQAYRFGYNVASFSIDRAVFRALWSRMDTEIKKDYPWVLQSYPTTATFNLFRNNATSDNKGTMDKWYNTIGIHGGLYEVSRPSSTGATASHKQDFLAIGLETSVNIVSSVIEHNQMIVKSNRLTYKYKTTE